MYVFVCEKEVLIKTVIFLSGKRLYQDFPPQHEEQEGECLMCCLFIVSLIFCEKDLVLEILIFTLVSGAHCSF